MKRIIFIGAIAIALCSLYAWAQFGGPSFAAPTSATSISGTAGTVSASDIALAASNLVNSTLLAPPTLNRYSIIQSNLVPWRIGGYGDSLGDDIPAEWAADFGRALGYNGGYLTVLTNTLVAPLTYTYSGNTTIPLPDTNWFAAHWTMGVGGASADVTFDQSGNFCVADTFRVAMAYNTNGGTFKVQVATNGGAFSDVTPTLSALTASPTGVVVNFNTNLGQWKLKVVNVSGTNVLIGGGMWASNKGGISPAQMWSFGGTLADVTNVSTNVTVPVLASLGLTEFQWHALDLSTQLTNTIPIFLQTLAMAGLAATNCDGLFIGVNNVTDNSTRYDLGNAFVRQYVTTNGYSYADTQCLGSTNDLVRRQWVTSGDCIHLNSLGIWYLADMVWRDGGVFQRNNAMFGTLLGNRTPLTAYAGFQQVSNLFEVKGYTPNGGGAATNLATISKDGFATFGGDRLTGTYMLDVYGNIFLGRTNTSTSLGFVRLNNSSSLAHQILFDAQNANTATITYERDSGRLTLNSGVGIDMNIDADNNQTGNAFTVNKDAANTTNAINLFKVFENGAVTSVAGLSSSNVYHGGTLFYSLASFTNLNGVPGTLTNLGNYSVPAHTLTNNGDRLFCEWGGQLAKNTANTNNFQITWGGTVALDTGLVISSNTTFQGWARIIRSGLSAQHVEAEFWFGSNAYARTTTNLEMTIDAGVAQTVALKGSAQAVGAHTNNSFIVKWEPGPK